MGLVLMVLGGLVCAVGGIWILVKAFQTSVLWGLGCLFVPFVSLVFVFTHWADTKVPFLINIGGAAVYVAGIMMSGDIH